MKRYRLLGIVFITIVIVVSSIFKVTSGLSQDTVAPASASNTNESAIPEKVIKLKGMIGSEKEALFNDPEIQNIAKTRFHITIDTFKAGSLEMSNQKNFNDNDFLFPASQTVVEKIKSLTKTSGTDDIFRTPLVYYSWDKVTKSLQTKGIVSKLQDGSFAVDNSKMIDLIVNDKKWNDIGLDIYGSIVIDTSDPKKSNSGNSYAALVATSLNQGNLITEATLPGVIPQLQKVFLKSGFKKASTSDLFNEYLTTGMGSHKIIVGYESDLLYFTHQNATAWNSLKDSVTPRILYPSPTLWSTHTIIALTPNGKIMNAFLKDPEIQKLAWERYGFRTGVIGIINAPAAHEIDGLSKSIDNVMQFPDSITMDHILAAFETNDQ
ncbi:hypothetical protein GK047_24675 [Paenibacillus sp. SYP-B3998]|uniref:Extracellular solute-binding protein n=1 Tax=Paenibacillus sp. SYP-B3998 TaxID=2678564 RepID=A0A6G4A3X9_9BACL|nr:hypothetical protein [Paenibacillus sp. SYP-B3998]NEW09173.1 hypothetical protein [Paenibacillus sp. SYP-B3998]